MLLIDVMSRRPLYEQLISQLEQLLLTGDLKTGDRLPSVRALSVQLAINPNTIQKAYAELDRRGILHSVPGKGCFVSDNATEALRREKRGELGALETMVRELALAGVGKSSVLEIVDTAYGTVSERSVSHDPSGEPDKTV